MVKILAIKKEYNSLEMLYKFLKKEVTTGCYIDFDKWDFRLDNKGQMEECLVLKKSSLHAVKIYFMEDNTANISYIIPNKMMNTFLGKRKRKCNNSIETIAQKIKQMLISGSQQKAFEELEIIVKKAAQ